MCVYAPMFIHRETICMRFVIRIRTFNDEMNEECGVSDGRGGEDEFCAGVSFIWLAHPDKWCILNYLWCLRIS